MFMLPSLSRKMHYPAVYVLSQIPNLLEVLKNSLPKEVEVKTLAFPGPLNRNLCLSAEEQELLNEAEVALGDCSLLASYFPKMPKLKWAHCSWAGVEPLMAIADADKSIPSFLLTRHGGSRFAALMAEYVVCQILNCERNMRSCWSYQQSKTWGAINSFSSFRSLDELTVAILGVGNMGCGIAKFLKARGSNVLGFSRSPRAHGSKEYEFFDNIFTDLADILPLCDYVCNTLPSTKDTHGLLKLSVLKLCSKKPVFINVGRGNIMKEEALVQALRDGCLSGAVLDVFENEPLPPSSDLWGMPNVVITPHIAAISKPEHIVEGFLENYQRFISGKELLHVANWSGGY